LQLLARDAQFACIDALLLRLDAHVLQGGGGGRSKDDQIHPDVSMFDSGTADDAPVSKSIHQQRYELRRTSLSSIALALLAHPRVSNLSWLLDAIPRYDVPLPPHTMVRVLLFSVGLVLIGLVFL
jgi:hypothetical protein